MMSHPCGWKPLVGERCPAAAHIGIVEQGQAVGRIRFRRCCQERADEPFKDAPLSENASTFVSRNLALALPPPSCFANLNALSLSPGIRLLRLSVGVFTPSLIAHASE